MNEPLRAFVFTASRRTIQEKAIPQSWVKAVFYFHQEKENLNEGK